jgi:hypothetical protein
MKSTLVGNARFRNSLPGQAARGSKDRGLRLLQIIDLDQRDADAAILAGDDGSKLSRRRQRSEDAGFLRIG